MEIVPEHIQYLSLSCAANGWNLSKIDGICSGDVFEWHANHHLSP